MTTLSITDIETAARAKHQQVQQQQEAAEEQRRAEAQEARERAQQEQLDLLRSELGNDICDTLGFAPDPTPHSLKIVAQVARHDLEIKHVAYQDSAGNPAGHKWHVDAQWNDDTLRPQSFGFELKENKLREGLLYVLGAIYEREDERTKREAALAAEQERYAQERERARIEDEQRRAERTAAAIAQHAGHLVELRQLIADTGRWEWPEGTTLTLYQVTWLRGVDTDGDLYHDKAWAPAIPEPATDGCIKVWQPHGAGWRSIRLAPEHLALWERHEYRSVEELPLYLKESRFATLYNVCWSSYSGHEYLFESQGGAVEARVCVLPIQWVRDLLPDGERSVSLDEVDMAEWEPRLDVPF